MTKKRTVSWLIWLIILITIVGGLYWLSLPEEKVDPEIAKCIGDNSHVYVQLGCHACETQEKMFGSSYKHLNTTDCFYDQNTCIEANIQGTPTWVIEGEKYNGVQSIDTIRGLTGC